MSKDHSTANYKERERILEEGGTISTNKHHGLVEGLLRATRALGNYGNRELRKVVPPKPFYAPLSLDYSFSLLVLGSSGLWDVLQPEDVAPIVQRCTHAYRSHHRHLEATEGGQRGLSIKVWDTVGDKQGAAESKEPNNPSAGKDADKDAGLEVDYEGLAASICRKLMNEAVAAGSRENITVMVILLQGLDVLNVQSENTF